MDRRPLDDDELALRDGLGEGASVVIAAGDAALETAWRDLEDRTDEWPVFTLRPSGGTGLEAHWWMSPNSDWRRDDLVVAEFTFGDFLEGISGKLGAPDRHSLTESVTECIRALVEGRATYEARKADPDNYDGPITSEALELHLRWRFPGEHGGSGGAVVRAYLGNPDAFADQTGIPIAEQLGEKHVLHVLGAPG
jgi:hypothetical protein